MGYYLPDKICIIVASHITNPKRVLYLNECLASLVQQTIPVAIYLSISFEDAELRDKTITTIPESDILNLRIREQKAPQMRHIEMVCNEIKDKYEWVLFCDDDDTYAPTRVERFAEHIADLIGTGSTTIAGAYENTFHKDHREQRHEYWCYCVNTRIILRFFNGLQQYPDVVENKCCDVLFAEYLRRLYPAFLYARITGGLYSYRVEQNADSITGVIKANQNKYSNIAEPPLAEDPAWAEYVISWNAYLHENINVFLHDTYLRTLCGVSFEDILTAEFRNNRPLLKFVDECHYTQMHDYHKQLWKACNEIYDIPI